MAATCSSPEPSAGDFPPPQDDCQSFLVCATHNLKICEIRLFIAFVLMLRFISFSLLKLDSLECFALEGRNVSLSPVCQKKEKKINEKADPVASNWVWLLNVAASVRFRATQTSRLHDFQIFWPSRSRFVAVSSFTVNLHAVFSRQWRWRLFPAAATFLEKRQRRPG